MPAADALPNELQTGLIQVLKDLNLTGDRPELLVGQKVQGQQTVDEGKLTYPCLVLSAEGEKETLGDFRGIRGTTEHVYRTWPLRLYLLDRLGSRDHSREAQYRSWRKQLIDTLDQKRPLAGQSSLSEPAQRAWCEASPEAITERDRKQYPQAQSKLLLRLFTREART